MGLFKKLDGITNLSTDGFVKTSGGKGGLVIDTTNYQPLADNLTKIAALTVGGGVPLRQLVGPLVIWTLSTNLPVDITGKSGKSTNLIGGNSTTLLGSIPYQSDVDTTLFVSPNTSITKKFLTQTGNGTNGAVPAWDTVTKSDVGLGSVTNDAQIKASLGTNIGDLISFSAASTPARIAAVASGQYLASQGVNTLPAWANLDATAVGLGNVTNDAQIKASIGTTKGDLITFSAASTPVRIAAGASAGNLRTDGSGNWSIDTATYLTSVTAHNILSATHGDTLTASVVRGDLIIGNATPKWSRLATGSANAFLTTNGTDTAWSTGFLSITATKTLTVNNTLTLSGTDSSTLNIGTGGTLGTAAFTNSTAYLLAMGSTTGATAQSQVFTLGATLSNITLGSVLFAGTAGVISQDNANLFWDNANKRLGLGISSPNELLEIANTTSSGARVVLSDGGGVERKVLLFVSPTAANDYSRIQSYKYGTGAGVKNLILQDIGGDIGIGTTSPSGILQVNQPTTGTGTVTTNGTTALVGTGTNFLNTFKVGDTINVSGETVRTINTITDNTHLTVNVAFSTSASELTYTLTGGVRFAILGNSYIGIGNTAPISILHIQSAETTVNNAPILTLSNSYTSTYNTNDVLHGIDFRTEDHSGIGARKIAGITIIDDGSSANTTMRAAMVFYTSAYNSNVVEAMRITSSGVLQSSFGINSTGNITINNATSDSSLIFQTGATEKGRLRVTSTGDVVLSGLNTIYFRPNGDSSIVGQMGLSTNGTLTFTDAPILLSSTTTGTVTFFTTSTGNINIGASGGTSTFNNDIISSSTGIFRKTLPNNGSRNAQEFNSWHEVGGISVSENAIAGTLCISYADSGATGSMTYFNIKGYQYAQDVGSWNLLIGGYNTTAWNNTSAVITDNSPVSGVMFVIDNGATPRKHILLTPKTTWIYPKIVLDVITGHSTSSSAYRNFPVKFLRNVRVATTTTLPNYTATATTLTMNAVGILTVDSVNLVLNNRVLVKDETNQQYNGVYYVSRAGTAGVAAILTRVIDADTWLELTQTGATVTEGTINTGTYWINDVASSGTLGTTVITFLQLTENGPQATLAIQYTNNSILDDTSTNATYYPIFSTSAAAGAKSLNVSSSKLTFNPSSGVLTATSIIATSYNNITITQPATSATLTLADGSSLITSGAYSLTLTTSATTSATLPSGTITLVDLSATQTLTNKRINPRLQTVATSVSPTITPTSDTADICVHANTSSTGTITIAAPTGTPVDGQFLTIRIKSTNAQTLSWNAAYKGVNGAALLTALNAGVTYLVEFQWDATNSKWDALCITTF